MKPGFRSLILMTMMSASLTLANSAPCQAQGRGRGRDDVQRYGWHTSYTRAKEEAQKTGKPLMVVLRCIP